jgi:hypothetical protein
MGKTNVAAPPETMPVPAKPKEPVPTMPQLETRPAEEKIGNYAGSWRFLIRGMGDRSQQVAAFFFKQLANRGIEGLKLSTGKLIIELDGGKRDSRDYYFAERDLGQSALATMAVRIAPVGSDLFVEWRGSTTPPLGAFHWGYFWGIVIAVGLLGYISGAIGFVIGLTNSVVAVWCFSLMIVACILGTVLASGKARKLSLEGFQFQENTAFQLAARAALEEAIDLAGISKALIQDLSNEKDTSRRVI